MWYWVASEAKTRQFKAEPVESFPEPSDPDKLALSPALGDGYVSPELLLARGPIRRRQGIVP